MKHNLEGSNANAIPKWRCVKEVERNIILEDLETINFVGCMHHMIWFVEKQEANWVEKTNLTQLRKFD
jgi:hypothetical protein